MARPPDAPDALRAASWHPGALHEALRVAAAAFGLPAPTSRSRTDEDIPEQRLAEWVAALADDTGLLADQAFASLDEAAGLLRTGAPLVLRLSALNGRFLLVTGSARRQIVVQTPEGQRRRLPTSAVVAAIRAPFEAALASNVNATLDALHLAGSARERARGALLRDRLASVRFRGCWMLRLPPGSHLRHHIRDLRLGQRLALLAAAYVGQYSCFIASWWLLGQATLDDGSGRGWLLGWLLLLTSLIPLRLLVTWEQGRLTLALGAWLRRRFLRGAFRVNRQSLKQHGVGELFSTVVEAASVDAMALSGGLASLLALVEVLAATSILMIAGHRLASVSLALVSLAAIALAAAYFKRRQGWTGERATMAHRLLESMMGHRTRLAQEPPDVRHDTEDAALEAAIRTGDAMDRTGAWLTLVPRLWLITAVITLVPAVAGGATTMSLAVAIGGVLLGSRALQRLTSGLAHLAGAIIAALTARRLVAAAGAEAGPPQQTIRSFAPRAAGTVHARALTFRYHADTPPVLDGATLTLEPGSRYLLEGPSGSGKSTLAAVLAGLARPDTGLVLSGGLDRAALGEAGWRERVVMAPQPHDNYLVGASLAFNLLMGRRWPADPADLAEAESLCRDLGLGDLLDRLPSGLDQVVGETGWQLSQGERARVFLARALLQRPDLVILDESLSALDGESVELVLRTLSSSGRSVLAIAHS